MFALRADLTPRASRSIIWNPFPGSATETGPCCIILHNKLYYADARPYYYYNEQMLTVTLSKLMNIHDFLIMIFVKL